MRSLELTLRTHRPLTRSIEGRNRTEVIDHEGLDLLGLALHVCEAVEARVGVEVVHQAGQRPTELSTRSQHPPLFNLGQEEVR